MKNISHFIVTFVTPSDLNPSQMSVKTNLKGLKRLFAKFEDFQEKEKCWSNFCHFLEDQLMLQKPFEKSFASMEMHLQFVKELAEKLEIVSSGDKCNTTENTCICKR